MGMPVLIGAGVGALSSAAMGKSPLTGALLGGATGGAFGGAGGFGSGFTQGGLLSSAAPAATTAATEGALSSVAPVLGDAALISPFTPTGVAGIQTANTSLSGLQPILGQAGEQAIAQSAPMYTGSQGMFDVAKGSTLGYDPSLLGGQGSATFAGGGGYDPSFLGRVKDFGSDAYNNVTSGFSSLTGKDALGLGLQGASMAMEPTPPVQPASGVQPIQRGSFDPSSVIAAAPSYGLSQGEVAKGKVGQIASQAKLNDEDERKIRQFYTSLIG
jgi:hypothetical protein